MSSSSSSSSQEFASEPPQFIVERIVAKRIRRGKPQYLVKWRDYDESENTWEPIKNFNTKIFIKDFEQRKAQERALSKRRREKETSVEDVVEEVGAGADVEKTDSLKHLVSIWMYEDIPLIQNPINAVVVKHDIPTGFEEPVTTANVQYVHVGDIGIGVPNIALDEDIETEEVPFIFDPDENDEDVDVIGMDF